MIKPSANHCGLVNDKHSFFIEPSASVVKLQNYFVKRPSVCKTFCLHLLDNAPCWRKSNDFITVRLVCGLDCVDCIAFSCPCLTIYNRKSFGSGRTFKSFPLFVCHRRAFCQPCGKSFFTDLVPRTGGESLGIFERFKFGCSDLLCREAVKLSSCLFVVERNNASFLEKLVAEGCGLALIFENSCYFSIKFFCCKG